MKKQVALLIETSSQYGRDLLTGIMQFMRTHDQWSVFLEHRDLWKRPPSWLHEWNGDGIISRATTSKLLATIQRTGVPLVEVTDRRGEGDLAQIRSDDRAIGELAAQHLLDRGFRRFGFCGFRREAWSERRQSAFIAHVERETGVPCAVLNTPWHGPGARGWEAEQQAIATWLGNLDPPFAIMACNDVRGQHVIDACSQLGLNVPEQAAVIGVDNDDLVCRMTAPPLSSVIPNASGVGFRAADTLAQLMEGAPLPNQTECLAPLGVATRQSTDVVAIEDRSVAAALHYIREHACRGLRVEDVVRHSALSRSTLERQLRKHLGRTPQEEIRDVQVQRADELLRTTDLSIEDIAAVCGFAHPEYLHVVFKKFRGLTMGEFRRQFLPSTDRRG